jgi:hypothetical protein
VEARADNRRTRNSTGGSRLKRNDEKLGSAVQAREDDAADVACQVAGGIGDAGSGGDEVLGGLDGDLVAGPVGVGAGTDLTASVTAVRSAWQTASSAAFPARFRRGPRSAGRGPAASRQTA